MLSILLPVYNFDVRNLVKTLHKQALKSKIIFEIVIIDDASNEEFREINCELDSLSHTQYIQLYQNVGRARIRNRLAAMAEFDYLIFMDCDTQVPDDEYINRYINYCKDEIVICGGTIYQKDIPQDKRYILRWKIGTNREEKPANKRNLNPNNAFSTNNFLISKSILKNVQFDETLLRYGHEDTLFGYRLKKLNYSIFHIDNPLYHIGLDFADDFIDKTKQAIVNLRIITEELDLDKSFYNDVTILRYFRICKKLFLARILSSIYLSFGNRMQNNLRGHNPSLFVFDLFKLSYLCYINLKSKYI